jgi:peroxiredoxin
MRSFSIAQLTRRAFKTLTVAWILAACSLASASTATPAPEFTLTARDGKAVTLKDLKGKVVMINFWASWCAPCRQEFPLLEQMYKRYNALGFTLLGVNVESDTKDAEKWLKEMPVTFPILFDKENKLSKLYAVNAMPSTVFIDRKGNIRNLHYGYKPGDESEYLNQIRALVKE